MTPLRRQPAIAALAATIVATAAAAIAGDAPVRSATPIRDSIDRVVARVFAEENEPCRRANEDGIPCFPVTIETAKTVKPTVSVRDSLREIDSDKHPSPNRPPTVKESAPFRHGPASAVGGVGFDPGCAGKAALKWLKGRNDTYYLYRVREPRGARIVMYDSPADPSSFQGDVELLGRLDGECEALAAYRAAERQAFPPAGTPAADPK